jgi:hypothetical protein
VQHRDELKNKTFLNKQAATTMFSSFTSHRFSLRTILFSHLHAYISLGNLSSYTQLLFFDVTSLFPERKKKKFFLFVSMHKVAHKSEKGNVKEHRKDVA